MVVFTSLFSIVELFCRPHHRNEILNCLNMTSYQKILNRKEWQDRSHFIKTRDNLKCQAHNCSTPQSVLEVHHLDYFSKTDPWNYPDDMLITLCHECHKKENSRYRLEGNLYTALRMKGFLACDILALTTSLYANPIFTDQLLTDIRKIQNG